MALENRKAKLPVTRRDLQDAWNEKAAALGFHTAQLAAVHERAHEVRTPRVLEDRVEEHLTDRGATFTSSELRAVLLEQSVGELAPWDALARVRVMVGERRVLPLEGGLMTTLQVRAREQAIERRVAKLARPADRDVGELARSLAGGEVAERIAGQLSGEQVRALEVITGPERAAVLVGPAGTGKGVVIDAAARAEQLTGREIIGVAVSGSTAQRLGQDSPALAGQTLTLDGLVARVQHAKMSVGPDTTIYFDEAGMADTARLDRLTELVERTGAKLVVIGDGRQLPSIGAGGMFDRLSAIAPSVELSNVRRTLDQNEQRAWADLRAGRSDRAMAHYHARGQLFMSDTRDQTVEHAVENWARLTMERPIKEVALISDASNVEIDRLNARAQNHRLERGELGPLEAQVPGVHYSVRQGDRVTLIAQHREAGRARIENGSQGDVLTVTPAGEVQIQFDNTGRIRTLAGEELASLRLGYAQHIHRAQGATVTRSLVITGGWQTSREPAYVEASRARKGTTWFVSREDLGVEGQDCDRIKRLSRVMSRSERQTPSLSHPPLPDRDWGPGFEIPFAPSRMSRIPGIARAISRLATPPPPSHERTR
jgi:ATP-dependent exoDNAse (exonuclease V) alpha subunit